MRYEITSVGVEETKLLKIGIRIEACCSEMKDQMINPDSGFFNQDEISITATGSDYADWDFEFGFLRSRYCTFCGEEIKFEHRGKPFAK